MTVLVFDAYLPGDAALENSHWMAERTRERLGDEAQTLTHPDARRANLTACLGAETIRGLAMFGHGEPGQLHMALRTAQRTGRRADVDEMSEAGAVYGCDGEAALDVDNLPLLRDRWCHAMACNVGLSLAHRAIDAGATCFVAYETSLTPEFEIGTLPQALHAHLAAVVTVTTLGLYRGTRLENDLAAAVQEAIEAMEVWLEGDEGARWVDEQEGFMVVAGLRGFARQMRRDMVLVSAPQRPTTAWKRLLEEDGP